MTIRHLRVRIEATKKAVLVNSHLDIESLDKNSTLFSRNFLVHHFITNKKKKIQTFPLPKNKDNYDFVVWLALNWFRDEKGNDLSSSNGISLGNIIARRILSAFSNDFRNYFGIKKLKDENYTIFASRDESESFKRVASSFEENIEWYQPQNANANYDLTPDPERTLFHGFPNIHKLSGLARKIQKPILKFTKKRFLLNISDWSSIDQFKKRNDTLIMNSLLPLKGYYLNLNKEFRHEANQIFPHKIDSDFLNPERIERLMCKKWNETDRGLAIHFCKLVQLEYQKGKDIFKRTFALYKEVFNYYKPKSIFIPGETHFAYVIAAHIAETLNIKTTLAIDGYQLVVDNSIFYKRKNGKSLLFDKFIAFGAAHRSILISSGVNEKDCIQCKSPLLTIVKQEKTNKCKIDVIIMCYNPNQHNPNITWDKRGEIIIDIITFLQKNNYKRIALKIKDGSNDQLFYKKILESYNLDKNVEFLTGPTYKYIKSTKMVIGQFSTALFEFTFNRIPYYIYEPLENGKTNQMINSAKVFNRKLISRDMNELENNLKNENGSVILNYNDMFEGKAISEINYDQFLN